MAPGPIPKRSEERVRRNKDVRPVDKVLVGELDDDLFDDGRPPSEPTMTIDAPSGEALGRPPANEDWHPVARMQYEALAQSGQHVFMEPSDWAQAYLLCEVASRELIDQPYNAGTKEEPEWEKIPKPMTSATLAALLKGFAGLGMSEGDRRRMAIELTRAPAKGGDLPEGVTDIATAREGLV